jgi:signal transduction histidine kinase
MLGSLRSRLALSNLAISLAAVIVLTLVFGQLLRQRTIDSNQRFLLQEARLVQNEVGAYVDQAVANQTSVKDFFAKLNGVSQLFEKRIVFFNRNGCAYDSGGVHRKPKDSGCRGAEAWQIAPERPGRQASGTITRDGTSYYVEQMPIHVHLSTGTAAVAPVVVLIAKQSAIIPSLSSLAPGFLLALVAASVIWVAMAIFFGYSVSRPLAKVVEASRAIAGGDYSRTVDIRNKGEMGHLASSFNHMVTQVRLTNQTLKDFVANVSHDLRTPITVISGFAGSLVDRTMQTPDEVAEAAGIIGAEARRMERLVDDLLQLTRLESGLRPFNPRPVQMFDLVESTIGRIEKVDSAHTIGNLVSEQLPAVQADEEMVERVLINLLNNALTHTPEGGVISVSASVRGLWMVISVSDPGTGISVEDQPRIFERFYRADKGRTGGSGHGLGLPIVKEIVEAHGGSVTVTSRLGAGSTFSFLLPLASRA